MSVVFVDATGSGIAEPKGAVARSPGDVMEGGLQDGESLVVYAPQPGWEMEGRLVELIEQSGARAIVVRAERADGFTPDPLAAACVGLIAGFGEAGIAEAVAFLGRSWPAPNR